MLFSLLLTPKPRTAPWGLHPRTIFTLVTLDSTRTSSPSSVASSAVWSLLHVRLLGLKKIMMYYYVSEAPKPYTPNPKPLHP